MGLRLVRDQLNDTLLTCCWCWCWRCSNYAVLSSQTASRNSTASGIQTAQSVFHATLWAGHHSRQSLIDTVQSLSLYRCTVDTSNRQTCQDGLSLIVGWHSVLCAQYVWKQREAADDCSSCRDTLTDWWSVASRRVASLCSPRLSAPRLLLLLVLLLSKYAHVINGAGVGRRVIRGAARRGTDIELSVSLWRCSCCSSALYGDASTSSTPRQIGAHLCLADSEASFPRTDRSLFWRSIE